ncbi:MAG: BREX-2 system adenine-specific DNA-methyltransferase PglX, partial [Kineosporiaceae bacterium]
MATPSTLTADLRRLVLRVEADLMARIPVQDGVEERWREEYDTARSVGRTATTWEQWSGSRVTQAAVAHVLATVFVRFCEDNGLIRQVWIAGPDGRTKQAVDAQHAYLREQTRAGLDVTDREWLIESILYLADLPATADMFRIQVNPLWQIAMSGDMATEVLGFWRDEDETGRLRRSFVDPALDTRFLGDLYQDLSESAREQYALLQTPEFVEEFILDLTLTPALAERPLDGFRLIDPTCGSGHFLLGAFDRLHEAWQRHAPALEPQARVQKVLDAVHGVDINPFAVAIAQFRLIVAALRVTGRRSLEDAPGYRLNLAPGDSLVYGRIERRERPTLGMGSEHDVTLH